MLGISNERIKMFKIFHILVTMATKVGGVAMYEKKPIFLAFLNYYSHSPSVHRDICS